MIFWRDLGIGTAVFAVATAAGQAIGAIRRRACPKHELPPELWTNEEWDRA